MKERGIRKSAVKFVEAAFGGAEFRLIAKVPLADCAGGVAERFEAVSDGFLGEGQAELGAAAIEFVAEAGLIPTGEQAGARRAAIRAGYIALGEPNAVFGERVDVWRRDFLVALKAEFAVADVVAEDDEDVWARGGFVGGKGREGQKRRKEEEQERFHGWEVSGAVRKRAARFWAGKR